MEHMAPELPLVLVSKWMNLLNLDKRQKWCKKRLTLWQCVPEWSCKGDGFVCATD